jgi:hypothetical protein
MDPLLSTTVPPYQRSAISESWNRTVVPDGVPKNALTGQASLWNIWLGPSPEANRRQGRLSRGVAL